MSDYLERLAQGPIPLLANRVWRTYSGGRLIEQWQGNHASEDGRFPEDWIASVVKATNVGREHILDEGLSKVPLADGSIVTLQDVIRSNPPAFLGQDHVEQFGLATALLVKVLDAAERLTIQVHPDNAFANTWFRSPFGKTEAWYVLGRRDGGAEPPYVLLGFKPGVTRETWRALFEDQDIQGMVNALHRIPIHEGQVLLVEAGTPHAIGEGCFLIEIQEPTDYTLRVERMTPKGESVPDSACHQGLGFDTMLESFRYQSHTPEAVFQRFVCQPRSKGAVEGGELVTLLDDQNTTRFAMDKLTVQTRVTYEKSSAFSVAIVVQGAGTVIWDHGQTTVRQGQSFFLPASLQRSVWVRDSDNPLMVILCHPPRGL